MKWLFRIFLLLAALAFAGFGYIAYPQWTLDRIWTAATSGDHATLETLIDWQSVRAGIRADMQTRMLKKGDLPDDGWKMLGAALGSVAADRLVDGIFSAETFILLVQKAIKDKAQFDRLATAVRFTGPTTFAASFTAPAAAGTLQVVMNFSGATWRVTRVIPPQNDEEFLKNLAATAAGAKP